MVGNDIIDLEWTRQQTNWRRKGFAQKVFTQEEQNLIHSTEDPFMTVWRMWSMKESAYKLFIQTGQDRFFNPLRLKCEISSLEEGMVNIEDLQIYTRSILNSKYIFTNANLIGNKATIVDSLFQLPKKDYQFQSQYTHQRLLESIAKNQNLEIDLLRNRKTDQGVPEVFYDGQRLDVSVSLTHNGHYGAYSMI